MKLVSNYNCYPKLQLPPYLPQYHDILGYRRGAVHPITPTVLQPTSTYSTLRVKLPFRQYLNNIVSPIDVANYLLPENHNGNTLYCIRWDIAI